MRSKTRTIVKKNKSIISPDNTLSSNELAVLSKVLLSLRNENKFETPADISQFKTDTVYFDVDDTLIKYKIGKKDKPFAIHKQYTLDDLSYNTVISIALHKTHIELLKTLHGHGKRIVVWSAATSEWAETVCKALNIDKYVHVYLTKPTAYVDDLNVKEWAKTRVWFKDGGK